MSALPQPHPARRPRRIYLASSWRNAWQPEIVQRLRNDGFEVYDFRRPTDRQTGFGWADIDPNWRRWSARTFRHALADPIALAGFSRDYAAMQWADAAVLAMPCGRSAHLEAGWFAGVGRPAYVFYPDALCQASAAPVEAELMYHLCSGVCLGITELLAALRKLPWSFSARQQRFTPRLAAALDRIDVFCEQLGASAAKASRTLAAETKEPT